LGVQITNPTIYSRVYVITIIGEGANLIPATSSVGTQRSMHCRNTKMVSNCPLNTVKNDLVNNRLTSSVATIMTATLENNPIYKMVVVLSLMKSRKAVLDSVSSQAWRRLQWTSAV